MAPLPKRGPGGRFLPRKSAAAARAGGARTAKRKNSAELLILGNPRKRRKNLTKKATARGDANTTGGVGSELGGAATGGASTSTGGATTGGAATITISRNPSKGSKAFKGPGGPIHITINSGATGSPSSAASDKVSSGATGFKKGKGKRLNPGQQAEAVALYEKFHGKTPTQILEIQESQAIRRDLAALGELVSLLVIDASGKTVALEFPGDNVKVASSPKGTQIYLIGGNQNIGGALGQFEADASKDFIELGECREIVYTAQKEFDKFETIDYAHEFGEEGGARPRLIYARLAKRLMLAGGDYKVDAPGIIN